jgi:hypothetical protein
VSGGELVNLGKTPRTRKRRAAILAAIKDGFNVNETGGRAKLAKLIGTSPMQISRDLKVIRGTQGPTSGIAVAKRGRPKADKTKQARTSHDAHAAGDYAHEHMQQVKPRKLTKPVGPTAEEAIRSAMLNPLLTDGSLDAGAELRIMLAADEGFPAALHHAFLQWGCERLMVMSRPIEHPDTGALEFPHLSPAEQLMAHSRLCQRIETARQLASDEPKLPKLVEVRVVVGGPDTPVKEGRERGGIGPVGDMIKVE